MSSWNKKKRDHHKYQLQYFEEDNNDECPTPTVVDWLSNGEEESFMDEKQTTESLCSTTSFSGSVGTPSSSSIPIDIIDIDEEDKEDDDADHPQQPQRAFRCCPSSLLGSLGASSRSTATTATETTATATLEGSSRTASSFTSPDATSSPSPCLPKRRVRFAPEKQNETFLIERWPDFSLKEMRNYWWRKHEFVNMKPTYQTLKRLHQNCDKKGCIRGLEVAYWTMTEAHYCYHMERANNHPNCNSTGTTGTSIPEEEFRKVQSTVDEFLAPSRPNVESKWRRKYSDPNSSSNSAMQAAELARYQQYVQRSERRAHILARMDELYVMDHVYGRTNSSTTTCPQQHLDEDSFQDESWTSIQCCSCHSYECRKQEQIQQKGRRGRRRRSTTNMKRVGCTDAILGRAYRWVRRKLQTTQKRQWNQHQKQQFQQEPEEQQQQPFVELPTTSTTERYIDSDDAWEKDSLWFGHSSRFEI